MVLGFSNCIKICFAGECGGLQLRDGEVILEQCKVMKAVIDSVCSCLVLIKFGWGLNETRNLVGNVCSILLRNFNPAQRLE